MEYEFMIILPIALTGGYLSADYIASKRKIEKDTFNLLWIMSTYVIGVIITFFTYKFI